MPYLVLNDDEMSVKGAPIEDRPHADVLSDALNSMETDGYALVAIQPAGEPHGGTCYVFHRGDPDLHGPDRG